MKKAALKMLASVSAMTLTITFAPFNFVNAEESPENTGISLSMPVLKHVVGESDGNFVTSADILAVDEAATAAIQESELPSQYDMRSESDVILSQRMGLRLYAIADEPICDFSRGSSISSKL